LKCFAIVGGGGATQIAMTVRRSVAYADLGPLLSDNAMAASSAGPEVMR
jgi:hypothetical protein